MAPLATVFLVFTIVNLYLHVATTASINNLNDNSRSNNQLTDSVVVDSALRKLSSSDMIQLVLKLLRERASKKLESLVTNSQETDHLHETYITSELIKTKPDNLDKYDDITTQKAKTSTEILTDPDPSDSEMLAMESKSDLMNDTTEFSELNNTTEISDQPVIELRADEVKKLENIKPEGDIPDIAESNSVPWSDPSKQETQTVISRPMIEVGESSTASTSKPIKHHHSDITTESNDVMIIRYPSKDSNLIEPRISLTENMSKLATTNEVSKPSNQILDLSSDIKSDTNPSKPIILKDTIEEPNTIELTTEYPASLATETEHFTLASLVNYASEHNAQISKSLDIKSDSYPSSHKITESSDFTTEPNLSEAFTSITSLKIDMNNANDETNDTLKRTTQGLEPPFHAATDSDSNELTTTKLKSPSTEPNLPEAITYSTDNPAISLGTSIEDDETNDDSGLNVQTPTNQSVIITENDLNNPNIIKLDRILTNIPSWISSNIEPAKSPVYVRRNLIALTFINIFQK